MRAAGPAIAPAPTRLRAYALLLRSRLASQLVYRRSFALDLVGQAATVLLDLVEVLVVFHQVPVLSGFGVSDVLVMFGLSSVGFSLADLAVGQIDGLGEYVRTGTLDIMLVRPLSVLGQLVTTDLQARRLGRVGLGLGVLVVALARADVDWTPGRVALLLLTPVCGMVIFASLWVATSSVIFFLVEGQEFVSAFTYGGSYLAHWPLSVLNLAVARFFTFVLPNAFVAYLPAVAILGRTDPTGLPTWLAWCTPVAALWTVGLAGLAWRSGLRRYMGAGG
ncbi:MAG: viologen exporter family transport system permease protein [Mycobacteriales bacterium]